MHKIKKGLFIVFLMIGIIVFSSSTFVLGNKTSELEADTYYRITTSGASETVAFGELMVCVNGRLFGNVTYNPSNKIDVTSINVTFSIWGFDPGIPINHVNNTFNMSVRVGNGLILKDSIETNETGLYSFISNDDFVIEADTMINVSIICSDGPATIVAIGTNMNVEPSILCKLTLTPEDDDPGPTPAPGTDIDSEKAKDLETPPVIWPYILAGLIGAVIFITIVVLKIRGRG